MNKILTAVEGELTMGHIQNLTSNILTFSKLEIRIYE